MKTESLAGNSACQKCDRDSPWSAGIFARKACPARAVCSRCALMRAGMPAVRTACTVELLTLFALDKQSVERVIRAVDQGKTHGRTNYTGGQAAPHLRQRLWIFIQR